MTKNVLKTNSFWLFLLGAVMIFLIYKFNNYAEYYYEKNNEIQQTFNKIKNSELLVNYNVLTDSIYMYENNDPLIKSVDKLEKNIDEMIKNKYFQEYYPYNYKRFLEYKKLIDKKIRLIYRFQTINSAIKNVTMNFAVLLNNLPKINLERLKNGSYEKNAIKNNKFSQKVTSLLSEIILAKSSIDKDFIKNLDTSFFEKLSNKINDPVIKEYNTVLLVNIKVFKKYFPQLVDVLRKITDKKTLNLLDKIYDNYFTVMNGNLKIIKWASYLLIIFIIGVETLIFYLLHKLQRESVLLKRLINELKYSYITDKLTGLYNRNKFDDDVKFLKKPVLLLVNIDRFKHINDYYGSKIGDKVLIEVSKILTSLIPENVNANLYRLGADDFGILYELDNYPDVGVLAEKIIKHFEKQQLEIDNVKFNISVTVGISMKEPLLENADIALKEIKKSFRKKFLIYQESMNIRSKIKENIEKSKILYDAIKENRIQPYFQPIVDTYTKEIVKYEVLARIVHPNGKVESIFPYLQIAKENKLYSDITKIMIQKTYDKVINKKVSFSLNVSVEDMLDVHILKEIYRLYFKDKTIAKRVSFEILESEAITDYVAISKFVSEVKKHGSYVAIDDFGSGYSNFEHLINLNVDFIKIDGSLIRQLPKNPSAYKIVKVINDFAKEVNIKTVAEFVADEKIYETVKKLGIDYCQGFYFYEPGPNCIT